ncbi:MAG: diguanylate cyclase [Candidatus Omnitrophota bacterium]|jgi:diguanylate cyclase (GGDEF)-like protein/PAS domain S-box-containing protein
MDEKGNLRHNSDERLSDELKFLQIRITELEKAESHHRLSDQLLRKTELQQKAILNSVPDIAWLKDKDGRFIVVNEAFGRSCGLRAEDVIGKTDLDIWPVELAQGYREDDQEVIRTGKRKRIEEPLSDKEGRIKWIETIKTPICADKGDIIGTVGIARDITERKKYEDRLRETKAELEIRVKVRTAELTRVNEDLRKEIESHKRDEVSLNFIKTAMDRAAEALFLIDSTGKFLYVNKMACDLLGYSRDELIGNKELKDIDPNYGPENWGKHWDELITKSKLVFESQHKTREGGIIRVRIIANAFAFEGQTVNFAFVTNIEDEIRMKEDIARYQAHLEELVKERTQALEKELSLRKELEAEGSRLKRQIEFVLGATKTGLDIIDSEFNLLFVDHEWSKIYGDYRGRKCYEYFMGAKSECRDCGVRKALRTKKITVSEKVLPAENNRLVQVISLPYKSDDGKWLVAEVNVDITERKKTEEELTKYRDHLEDIVRERTVELLKEISEHKDARRRIAVLADDLTDSNKKLKQLSLTDSHTGLYNHRYLGEVIEAEFHRSRRFAHHLAIIMLDIDFFKSINDVYGHQFGDLVLKQFAGELKKIVRRYDIVIRFGGEEFLVISPGIDRQQVFALSQRILEDFNRHNFGNKKHAIKLKISIGAVSYPEDNAGRGMDLVNLADQILNKVKESGGNRVYLLSDLKKEDKASRRKRDSSPGINVLKSKIEKLNKRANQSLTEAILAFAKTIELKDHYTGEHVELTGHFATLIANKLGLDRDEVELIRQASILHDLGKIGISEKILLKKSKLTEKEFEEIKKHPQIGADILRPIHFLQGLIPIIFYHHARWDGKGYPRGIRGEDIPIGARIIALADVYQALTSDRPYRKAYSRLKAAKIIRSGSGTQFDPKITEIFLGILQEEE